MQTRDDNRPITYASQQFINLLVKAEHLQAMIENMPGFEKYISTVDEYLPTYPQMAETYWSFAQGLQWNGVLASRMIADQLRYEITEVKKNMAALRG